jgi:hypothetical protein
MLVRRSFAVVAEPCALEAEEEVQGQVAPSMKPFLDNRDD